MRHTLHPAATFILWLCAVFSVQFLTIQSCVLLAIGLVMTAKGVVPASLRFARKGKWLLMMLWLIFAYGKAGDPWFDLEWGPTVEGVAEANIHVIRLLAMLFCLAWLFARLERKQCVAAIFFCLQPLAHWGVEVERWVVRLSLVMMHLAEERAAIDWRKILIEQGKTSSDVEIIQISMPLWKFLDSLLVFFALSCTLWIVL